MSDNVSQMELVSSFMDGETGEVPDGLCRDNAAKACWRRYHLIREVLRDSKPACLSGEFSTRLMQALENEPTVIAPRLFRRRNTLTGRLFKPVAGMAIAATVAAVAVVGFQNLFSPGLTDQPRVAGSESPGRSGGIRLTDTPSAPRAAPINQQTLVSTQRTVGVEENTRSGETDDNINSYLLEHMEQSTGGHAPSMLPYVRLAGYENNR